MANSDGHPRVGRAAGWLGRVTDSGGRVGGLLRAELFGFHDVPPRQRRSSSREDAYERADTPRGRPAWWMARGTARSGSIETQDPKGEFPDCILGMCGSELLPPRLAYQ